MRASHSSKTYQLGPARTANSACFRDFLTKITGFPGIYGGIAPTADALAVPAVFRRTLYHFVCWAGRCPDGGGWWGVLTVAGVLGAGLVVRSGVFLVWWLKWESLQTCVWRLSTVMMFRR